MKHRTIGILGGMGPESTAALYLKITRLTPIVREQDHLRIIIDSNPKIPDRTEAIRSGSRDAAIRALTETARNIERAGAQLIGIPCNTAHAFLEEIRASVGVSVVDMVDETAQRARDTFGAGAAVGLLTTDGVHLTGLYHRALARVALTAITPDTGCQSTVMSVIGEVKRLGVAERHRAVLAGPIRDLGRRGATALIAGCTEISLLLSSHPPDLPWLDPLDVLAEALIRDAVS
jgi:aspartate racemase